jgi:hypothetical protein
MHALCANGPVPAPGLFQAALRRRLFSVVASTVLRECIPSKQVGKGEDRTVIRVEDLPFRRANTTIFPVLVT